MHIVKNETGNRYGKLTVIKFDHMDKSHNAYFLCACDCGCTTVVKGNRLRNGRTKSCGCLKREAQETFGERTKEESSKRMKEFNASHRPTERQKETMFKPTHGGTNERLFRIWSHMKERCNSTKGVHSKWYHEKGIRVCDEWQDYSVFKKWAFESGYAEQPKETEYKELFSIDRIDPDKNYCPENCRWITVSENSRYRNVCHANQR
jgi:hypothetical protein